MFLHHLKSKSSILLRSSSLRNQPVEGCLKKTRKQAGKVNSDGFNCLPLTAQSSLMLVSKPLLIQVLPPSIG